MEHSAQKQARNVAGHSLFRRQAWVAFVSGRWFAARKESGGAASSVLAAMGLAVGVAALIVVMGVMNGFQLGYIESILNISSFHIRITEEKTGGPDWALVDRLSHIRGVQTVLPFVESEVLATSLDGNTTALKIMAVPRDAPARDPDFYAYLNVEDNGSGKTARKALFDDGQSVLIGSELSRAFNLISGSTVRLSAIIADPEEGISTRSLDYEVSSRFRSGYYDFDSNLAFIPIEDASKLLPASAKTEYIYGIKLKDRYADRAFFAELKKAGLGGIKAESWRDYNRSFFGALKTEKTVMMLLVGLIFIVVSVNIYHSMRRNVAERMDDIAVLKALGGSAGNLTQAFMLDGLAIGLVGASVGLVTGMLVALNINGIFRAVELVVNGTLGLFARLSGAGGTDFSIFSPQYFYLMEVPVRILYPETFFIVAAAIASAVAAAGKAAARVSSFQPAEVLRYE